MQMKPEPKGPEASSLRKQKFTALRSLQVPEDALAGSLSRVFRRCGKPTCRCATGEGHPIWHLTFMVDGKKRVEHIPEAWAEDVQRRIAEGRQFKDAVNEAFTANTQLLVLSRRQRKG